MSEDDPMFPRKFPGRRFRVHVISAGILVVAVIAHALEGYANGIREHRPQAEAIGRAIGAIIALPLMAYGLGWLGFYACRRSQLCGNLIFCLFLLLINLAMLPQR